MQTMIYNVYLSIYLNIQGISVYILAWDIAKCLANLWIEGMKAPLRHIKWITSGTHCTPGQLRLPFHSESTHCNNDRTYTTSTKYILVYTRMYFVYLCIYSYILWYTDIYYFNKVYTRIYSYVLCISVYIRLNTSPRDFPWDLDLSFSWNLMLSYISRCTFLRKQCYHTSADMRKPGYFIILVRGCPGSQLSKGFEINEDVLRYATVHTLIYACFHVHQNSLRKLTTWTTPRNNICLRISADIL